LNCTIGQIIKFDASGFAGCGSDSTGAWFQWTTTGSDIYYTTGKMGVGMATSKATLDIAQTNGDVSAGPLGYALKVIGGRNTSAVYPARGGDISLAAGMGIFGGNVNIAAGSSWTSGPYSTGATLNLDGAYNIGQAGSATLFGGTGKNGEPGGSVVLAAGDATTGPGGDVRLSGGPTGAGASGGNVYLNGGLGSWASTRANVIVADLGGKVGVGTAAPVVRMDVSGTIKVGDGGESCSSSKKGSIRYNNVTSVLEFCNGTGWNLIQAAACNDPTPDTISFTNEANATTSTLYFSDIQQLSGINCSVPVTITGQGSPQYQICSDASCTTVIQAWTSSPSSVTTGQYLQTRLTTDNVGGASFQVTLIIGSGATVWTVTTAGGDCTGSPSIGTVCADGTIYAGLSPDGNNKMFTTRCDAGQTWDGSICIGVRASLSWNNGTTNRPLTGYSSAVTGKTNSAGLYGLSDTGSPYEGAAYCETLNINGKTDWYLPALSELNILYSSKNIIRNFDTSGSYYWSATEYSSEGVYAVRFSDG
jgi:hypothetical protein